MKYLSILLALFMSFSLSAQCEDLTDNCPGDLSRAIAK